MDRTCKEKEPKFTTRLIIKMASDKELYHYFEKF